MESLDRLLCDSPPSLLLRPLLELLLEPLLELPELLDFPELPELPELLEPPPDLPPSLAIATPALSASAVVRRHARVVKRKFFIRILQKVGMG